MNDMSLAAGNADPAFWQADIQQTPLRYIFAFSAQVGVG